MVKDEAEKKKVAAATDFAIQLDERQLCDVELICNGGLSPITGPMNEATYKKVVEDMRLPSGELFGLPIVFATDDARLVPGNSWMRAIKFIPSRF